MRGCVQCFVYVSICVGIYIHVLTNTNIYLRFAVLENLVNNVND